jgi:hypothetical protein
MIFIHRHPLLNYITIQRQEWRKIPKFSHNFIRTVSRICLSTENPSGYIWEPIAAFLKTRQVSAAAIPNLVPSILKAKKLVYQHNYALIITY